MSERSGLERIDKQMKNKPFYVEPKHDGERVQLHKDGDRWGRGSDWGGGEGRSLTICGGRGRGYAVVMGRGWEGRSLVILGARDCPL